MTDAADAPKGEWGFEEGDEIVPGRYALKSLGGGYDYEAFLTWDEKLSCLVVAKLVRPNRMTERNITDLEREGGVLNSLAHPMIVRCFDVVTTGERPHLLLEYLQGDTLRHLIRHGAGIAQLLPLALSICSALHYLREMDMVHLDIKSRNIVMGVPPVLIDFSVARPVKEAAKISGRIGTDAYMAPEQCDPKGRGPVGPPADVWGLGATLYRAVNGRLPFETAPDADEKILDERFPQLWQLPAAFEPEVPKAVAEIILWCMTPEPELRPAPLDIAAALEPLVEQLPRTPLLRRRRPGAS